MRCIEKCLEDVLSEKRLQFKSPISYFILFYERAERVKRRFFEKRYDKEII